MQQTERSLPPGELSYSFASDDGKRVTLRAKCNDVVLWKLEKESSVEVASMGMRSDFEIQDGIAYTMEVNNG